MRKQATSEILMIRPVAFGYNEQTAINNAFQKQTENHNLIQETALQEFDNMVKLLQENGINVRVIKDTLEPHTPDSIFPNNWVSFHENEEVILYPMFAQNRRLERRKDILHQLESEFFIDKIKDLTYFEEESQFLEGTGSLVLDRKYHLAYATYSPRTHQKVLDEFFNQTDYEIVSFSAFDESQMPIYHSNVMLTICEKFVIICLESITNEVERNLVKNKLEDTEKEIITISFEQMNHFAGNMLELQNKNGESLLLMSKTAFNSLEKAQIQIIEKYAKILSPDIPTIEQNGGGGVRCMICEIFLPKKSN